jgi:mannitol/fructose-specific phosphotransferase system IIA component (Ntr-type)/galactitol-specific phosphotransferase system IIB component
MKLSEEDIGYIALHFAASLERDIMNNNIKVIIVCSSGVGTAELIKSRIMKNMPNVSVIGVYPEYMLDVLDLSGIDLIISTVETINFNIDKEIVNVSPLLLREDIVKLNEHISRQREYDYLETLMIDKLFFLDISAENKEEAIECMCQRLIGNEIISQETAEAIKNREKISSTEINDLVAIPHCIAGTGKKSVIAVGILEKPILWDKTFVQLVFLGSLDPNIAENRHVFTMLYKLTKKKEKVKELIKLKNLSEFKRKLFVK